MNVLRIVEWGHNSLLKTVQDLSEEQWINGFATGTWTAKDILAHLATYEAIELESFKKVIDPGTATPLLDQRDSKSLSEFNTARWEIQKKMPWKEILNDYTIYFNELSNIIKSTPAELFAKPDTIVRYGAPSSLEDVVALDYGHKRHHLAQIKLFIQRIGK